MALKEKQVQKYINCLRVQVMYFTTSQFSIPLHFNHRAISVDTCTLGPNRCILTNPGPSCNIFRARLGFNGGNATAES